uniref:Uncharacterized protein n=1 Tax=Candidatus Kentrum sp. DK TaxID=2126562 RepID=A0A450SSP2_9GAMM|nr:MAG: hypothetical protein BECKDK2373B_GA0170837_10626 [Candidatus Kentron sp. DK]
MFRTCLEIRVVAAVLRHKFPNSFLAERNPRNKLS